MELRLYWLGLGVVLFILEMFIMSFDALALGIAAFVTAILTRMMRIDITHRQQSLIIFLIASVIALMLVRLLIAPKLQANMEASPMSGDSIKGKKLTVQEVNGRDVIKYEGMYWNIQSDQDYKVGDKVRVIDMEDNIVRVQKV